MGRVRYEWRDRDSRDRRLSMLMTGAVLVVVLLILFIFGFVTPLPLPGEEGIAVSFGRADGVSESSLGYVRRVQRSSVPVSESPKERSVLTQDYEEAPSLPVPKRTAEPEQPHLDQRQRDRLDASRVQDTVREDEGRAEDRAASRVVNPDALFPGGGGSGVSDGDGPALGSPDGHGSAGGQGKGTSGTGRGIAGGGGGAGISFSLGNRQALYLPSPVYPTQKSGRVVVRVWVGRNGKVIDASAGVQGSTTFDAQLLEAARQAALKASFDVDVDAPERQVGTITYVFKLTQRN